mmetsp:Transcript_9134/g.11262  ORF Transcript_9134/g.11262 Transcript_9134/m.11262 type:complete len:296 (+) Transcript_9134:94-981(+)
MNYTAVLICSGLTTLLSMILTANLINQHRQNWSNPAQQTNIIKIILLAPIFAIDSFVGILELDKGEIVAHVLDMVKECYEAVVIHAFLMLMYNLCGLNSSSKETKRSLPEGVKGRNLHLPFPMGLYFGPHAHFDHVWVERLRFWTLQFIMLRPGLSLLDLIFVDIIPNQVSQIISIVIIISLNVSVTTAVYALITFYHGFEKELAPHRPLAKFVCIKGVVFFAVWQGVALKLLARWGVLHEGYRFSVDDVALAWQDLLICVEMGLIFCPLNQYAFTASEYRKGGNDVVGTAKKID